MAKFSVGSSIRWESSGSIKDGNIIALVPSGANAYETLLSTGRSSAKSRILGDIISHQERYLVEVRGTGPKPTSYYYAPLTKILDGTSSKSAKLL
jgi:hypothetical protein